MLRIDSLKSNNDLDLKKPILLYDAPNFKISWVGSVEDFIFRCNTYLISSPEANILIDPGGVHFFDQVKFRVEQLIGDPKNVTHIIAHHQDPDVVGSITHWIKLNEDIAIITTPRTKVLLPYYGFDRNKVNWLDVSSMDDTILDIGNESSLVFLSSPFLHFPDAFVTYDSTSKILFSSDIFAAVQKKWQLVVTDFKQHINDMLYFHVYYMASRKALNYFVNKIKPFEIKAIAPQHGSIIPAEYVDDAIRFLEFLRCGLDLLEEKDFTHSSITSALNKI